MSLHLLPPADDSATIRGSALRTLTRPGERHECIAVEEPTRRPLIDSSRRCGLAVSTVAGLLVESRLCLDWADQLDVGLTAGHTGSPLVALSAAEADYLRLLTVGRTRVRRCRNAVSPERISFPVRLIARASHELLARAAELDPERAIAFEVCALREGMLIGEWGARRVVAIAGGSPTTTGLPGGAARLAAS